MKTGKKLRVACLLLFVLAVFLTACQKEETGESEKPEKKPEVEAEEEEISQSVQEILRFMMTGPNKDLLFVEEGEGTGQTKEAVQEQNDVVEQKWQEAIGRYFAEGRLHDFLTVGPALQYLREAQQEALTLTLVDMESENKGEYSETVKVRYRVGEKEREATLLFEFDYNGAIVTGKEEGTVMEVQEYEARAISQEEFLTAYAKERSLSEEEAAVQLEEEHRSLIRYGIRIEDYKIVYEERKKDKDVGDGLILTATIFTEVLLDPESDEAIAYGIAAARDTWIKGEIGGISDYASTSGANNEQNGNVHVTVLGQAIFQTDGSREFSKGSIQKITGNSYRYEIDEEIVFTF